MKKIQDLKYYNFVEDLHYYRFGMYLRDSDFHEKIDPEDELLLQLIKAGKIEELYKVFNFRRRLQKRFTFWNVRRDRFLAENYTTFFCKNYKRFKIEHPLK